MPILCGSDLSAASTSALDVALALAGQRGDREVILLHVVDPEGLEDAAIESRLAAGREMFATLAAVRTGAVVVRPVVTVGPPDQTLVTTAETENAALIVIAASSQPGGSLIALGTTAQRVVAQTTVPVILIRDPAPWLAFARGERPLRLLLGVDDSATCDLGIQWLHELRALAPVDVVLGAVYYPDDAAARYGVKGKAIVDRDPEIELLIDRDLVRRFGAPGEGRGTVTPRARRGLGRIGDHVLELARDEQVDAIIVGTNQKTGLGRLGSVSSIIVHDAEQSVVCIPPNPRAVSGVPVLARALVATDFSAFANRAIPYAFSVVQATGEVHVIHVVGVDDEVDEAELNAQLAALTPTKTPQRLVTHVVRGDDAATAIAQAAARFGVDIICIASHGRSGITRALVGSVADRLLRATRLPVLVLRPG